MNDSHTNQRWQISHECAMENYGFSHTICHTKQLNDFINVKYSALSYGPFLWYF